MNVPFRKEVRLEGCKNKKLLPFDFGIYTSSDKLLGLIEYNGSLHYSARGTGWNTPERLIKAQKNDYIKQLYCENQRIPLLIIPYTISDIKEFLITSDFWNIITKNFND